MANILDYLSWRADMPLNVDPFNEVDGLILSELAYLDFDGIVPGGTEPVPLEKVCAAYHKRHPAEEIAQDRTFRGKAPRLLTEMLTGARFRDARLMLYTDEMDPALSLQMSAVTFLLPDRSVFVAFRGTDGTLVGWEEDFSISHLSSTEGQKRARAYLDLVADVCPGEIRVGGHSKGGNLAVYAAAFCAPAAQERITRVLNYDGPGFRDEIIASDGYGRILPRAVSIVPDTSVIGLLLKNSAARQVVRSTAAGIAQHDGFTWSVERNRFETASLTTVSLLMDRSLDHWLSQMDDETRRSFTETVFSLFRATGAESFGEINRQKRRSAESIITAARELPKEQQQSLLSLLQQLGLSGGQVMLDLIAGLLKK